MSVTDVILFVGLNKIFLSVDNERRSILHLLAIAGARPQEMSQSEVESKEELIKFLLKFMSRDQLWSQLKTRDMNRDTPLSYACRQMNYDVGIMYLTYLVESLADCQTGSHINTTTTSFVNFF